MTTDEFSRVKKLFIEGLKNFSEYGESRVRCDLCDSEIMYFKNSRNKIYRSECQCGRFTKKLRM